MSFSNYPEYQEIKSLSWSIPKHWTAPKLAHLLRLQSGDSITSENIEVEGDFAVYGGNGLRGYTDKYNCIGEYILVGRQGALCGNVHVASGKFFASEHAVVVYPKSEIANRYFFYLLTFMNLGQYSVAAAQPGLSVENISQLRINFPPITEQTQIARFLDHEVGKINALIAEQEKLIALLKEKRQAVISHAVTKGLNPDAPMKDSGVEWLGQVPEHWLIKSYRYACMIYRGKFGHRPRNDPSLYDGEYPFIQTGDIAQAGKFIVEYKQTLNEKGKQVSQKFPAGTLVMAIAANIGDTAILEFDAYAPDSVVGFKPINSIILDFLRYSLICALPALEQTSTQSSQANLNIDRISSVLAVFPPYEEQNVIVEYLDKVLHELESLESSSHHVVSLLSERRSALISAAVTGKIDVRGWQTPVENINPANKEVCVD